MHTAHTQQEVPFYKAWIPTAPTVIFSLVAVYAVHRLTKLRDREKLIDEFHTKIESTADSVVDAAYMAWSLPKGDKRKLQIALVKSRMQKLGSLVNRLELISVRRRFRWAIRWPVVPDVTIKMGQEMLTLRQEITSDPFEEPERNADTAKAINCESAKSVFLMSLDLKYRNWVSPF